MTATKRKKSRASAPGTPTDVAHAVNSKREENVLRFSSSNIDDDSKKSECVTLKTRNHILNIGTWNVRTLNQLGKFENLIQEAKANKLDVLGISESRLIDTGMNNSDDTYTFYNSGGHQHIHGVGLLIKKTIVKSLLGIVCVSKRNILAKIKGAPFNMSILQTYAPTADHTDEEIEEYYEEVSRTIKTVKSDEILIVMGDMNAKVGKGSFEKITGNHGLGTRNERGERLIQFCSEERLSIVNTFFKHPNRRLYTWKSPGDVRRNQIDYIMIRHRFQNSIRQCRTYPGADIESDHNPVIAKMNFKLKKMEKSSNSAAKADVAKLMLPEIQEQYSVKVENRYSILFEEITFDSSTSETQENFSPEQQWKCLKQSVQEANELLPKVVKKKKKEWMTEEILQLMDDRKAAKTKDLLSYKKLSKKIKAECTKAKEDWLDQQCSLIEQLNKDNKSKNLHREVKNLTGSCISSRGGNIKDRNKNLLFEKQDILDRWKEYVGELFEDNRCQDPPEIADCSGPTITKDEVEAAIRQTKGGKAPGEDNITSEMWKALGPFGVEKLTLLFNSIYDTGQFPDDLVKSIFLPLPKKAMATECGDHRLISLMPHATKIFLRVILNRVKQLIDTEVDEVQFGFRPGRGTREGIFSFNIMAQKHIEVMKEMYICFIDYAKAFDRVKHENLIECLKQIGLDSKDVRVITNLYWHQKAAIRVNKDISEYTSIQRGVRQGCVLSPILFNIYTELIFRQFEHLEGTSIGGRNISNLRYVDDTVLVSDTKEGLQSLVTAAKIESEKAGLGMNVKKTKTMIVSKQENVNIKADIQIDNETLEQVSTFKYLGQTITPDGKNDLEIKIKIAIAKNRFQQMYHLLTSKKLSMKLRHRLLVCYVFSVILYGCETWTLTKALMDKIEACEMWFLRRMGKISWKQKMRNEDVLKILKTEKTLLNTIKARKLKFFGHTKRHESLMKNILEGKMEGRRPRGRPRAQWCDNIREWSGHSLAECTRLANQREVWRQISSQPWTQDDTKK